MFHCSMVSWYGRVRDSKKNRQSTNQQRVFVSYMNELKIQKLVVERYQS